MWVDTAWRGRGVADALLDAVVDWAKEGATRLGLDVTDRVPRARRFYERTASSRPGAPCRFREIRRSSSPRWPSVLVGDA